MSHEVFQCTDDAKKALQPHIKSLKYHQIHYEILPIERHSGQGRPKSAAQKVITGYQVQPHLPSCLQSVRAKKETLGRFILASNQCDNALLSNPAILAQYKEQSCVESSFKFIKNNAFELDSFFLKTPARITALMIVTNIKTVHKRIIAYFGKHALEIYGLQHDLARVPINHSNYKNLLHWCER